MLSKSNFLEKLLQVKLDSKCHYTKTIFFSSPDCIENKPNFGIETEIRTEPRFLAYHYTSNTCQSLFFQLHMMKCLSVDFMFVRQFQFKL